MSVILIFYTYTYFVFKGGKEVAEMGDLAARNIQRGRDHGSR